MWAHVHRRLQRDGHLRRLARYQPAIKLGSGHADNNARAARGLRHVKRNKRNYYRILHVQPDAPLAMIKASYRTLMQKLRKHPDLGGDEWDAAVVNEAYFVLSNEHRRRAYDARLSAERMRTETGHQSSAQRSEDKHSRRPSQNSARRSKHDRKTAHTREPRASRAAGYAAYSADYVDSHECAFCGSVYRGVLDVDTDCANCQSPLRRLEPFNLGSSGQRNIHRVSIKSKLTLHTAWPGPRNIAILHDMSPNGLQFHAEPDLARGQRVRLDCPIFTAVAEITNRSAHQRHLHRYGARFITLRYRQNSGTYLSASV